MSLLVTPSVDGDDSVPPFVPEGLCTPYLVTVPLFPSCTKAQLRAKNKLWPCAFVAKRLTDAEKHIWSLDEVQWLRQCMARVVGAAMDAKNNSEVCLPITKCDIHLCLQLGH